MPSPQTWISIILILLLLACAGPQPYRFLHPYSVPQALRFVRQMLLDRGYRIAIFDPTTGVIKTERSQHTAQDGSTVSYQISVKVVTTDELIIKVLPASARSVVAEIMAPLSASLRAMGFNPERAIHSPPGS
jgi:hypothetical protein